MSIATYEYKIPSSLICGIEYDSFDDLNDDELKAINNFWSICSDLVKINKGNGYTIEYSEDSEFSLFEYPFTSIAQSGDITNAIVTIL